MQLALSEHSVIANTLNISEVDLIIKSAFTNKNFLLDFSFVCFFYFSVILIFIYHTNIIEEILTNKTRFKKSTTLVISWLYTTIFFLYINSVEYKYAPSAIKYFRSDTTEILLFLCEIAFFITWLSIKNISQKRKVLTTLIIIALTPYSISFVDSTFFSTQMAVASAENSKPNIIFIGIDSLRPDKVDNNTTPNIFNFIQQSTKISNIYTPAARTFSSWTSTLSGQYPIDNNARFNLTELDHINKETLLTKELKALGYQTIFAQDERRFSNIDQSYYFDTVIGPPAKAIEFLVDIFNTNPVISILSTKTSLRYVNSYIYGNRSAWWTYNPADFVDKINLTLKNINHKPTFFACHLTLPHWPFKSSTITSLPEKSNLKADPDFIYPYVYQMMLSQADSQFKNILDILSNKGMLKNAIIVLLSDHGESFAQQNDGPQAKYDFVKFTTNDNGHGTNVLSNSQFRVVTSVMLTGNATKFRPLLNKIDQSNNYSLVDLTPTISSMLDENGNYNKLRDGQPFWNVSEHRPIVLESSLNPLKVSKKKLDVLSTIANGVEFYTLGEDGKLIVKPSLYEKSIALKQRAIIQDDLMVATFPEIQDNLIVTDLKSHVWWPASVTESSDRKVRIQKMYNELCKLYKKDVKKGLYDQCQDPNTFMHSTFQSVSLN